MVLSGKLESKIWTILFLIILLRFLDINPGQQLIGSFNPINSGDWAAEAYQRGTRPVPT